MLYPKALLLLLVSNVVAKSLPAAHEKRSSRISPRQNINVTPNIVRRFFHGSFVMGKTLYIDGGECSTTTWAKGNEVYNDTLAIDLSSAFSTVSPDQSSLPSARVINKGKCPNFNLPAFWVDSVNKTVYAYGGEFSYLNPWVGTTTVPPEALWAYTEDNGGTWNNIDQTFDSVFSTLVRPSHGGFTQSKDGGFYLGGKHTSRASQKTNIGGAIASPGIQFYNFSSATWTNSSTSALYTAGSFMMGTASYVPNWGTKGLVIGIGGRDVTSYQAYPWNNITIFDPSTQKWYYQTASGDTPVLRDSHCSVGTSAQTSNGTFEIYIYGGSVASSEDVKGEGDALYILSLPAFRWFKTSTESGDARRDHTCNIVGNTRMFSIGGLDPSLNSTRTGNEGSPATTQQWNTTDPYLYSIKILHLPSLTWTNRFSPEEEAYSAPSVIKSYYAGDQKWPNRWNSNELRDIFTVTKQTTSTSPTPTPAPEASKSNTGAIAGGVVGGVLGLLAIGGMIWFFFVRKSKTTPPTEDTRTNHNDHSEKQFYSSEDKAVDKSTAKVKIGELDSPHGPAHELEPEYFPVRELPSNAPRDKPSAYEMGA